MTEELAVVGGGAYAAVFVNILTERLFGTGKMPRITVFDASSSPWTGQAFQEDTDPVLINTPAGWMSASAADPQHYVRWLKEQHRSADGVGSPVTVDSVGPRPVYGRYLRQVVADATRRAARDGGALHRVQDEIVQVSAERSAVHLNGISGTYGPFDKVLLCIGAGKPSDPYRLTRVPGYISDPYPLGKTADSVPADARALIVGTGLTAVDVALSLLSRQPNGPITMVSRTGLLPMPRAALGQIPTPIHLTRPRIENVIRNTVGPLLPRIIALVDAELREIGTDLTTVLPQLAPRTDAATRLREALAIPQGHPWQAALVNAAKEHFSYVYHHLSDAEKQVVVKEMHPYIRSFAVPMPRSSATRLLAALDSGALRVFSGLTSVHATHTGFQAQTLAGTITASVVFNATSSPMETWQGAAASLITSLTAMRSAQLAPHGGLQTDLHGRILDATGQAHPHLAALGSLTRGSHYYIDAVALTLGHSTRLLDVWYP